MSHLRACLASLCALVLGAHCLRAGWLAPLTCCLVIAVMAWIRKPWALRTVAIGLTLGGMEWIRTLLLLRAERLSLGLPYQRMTLILGTVAACTLLAALGAARAQRATPASS